MSCKYCDELVEKINNKYPDSDWNCDKACNMWRELSPTIPDRNIEFKPYSDESYACTCPNCGEYICGWCV